MAFALWMAVLIGGPIVLLAVGFYFLTASNPESKNIKDALDSETQKLSRLDWASLDALCQKEPVAELDFGNARFIRTLTSDKFDKKNLVVRVTLTGTINKSVEESKTIVKALPI